MTRTYFDMIDHSILLSAHTALDEIRREQIVMLEIAIAQQKRENELLQADYLSVKSELDNMRKKLEVRRAAGPEYHPRKCSRKCQSDTRHLTPAT